jgi:hypothetical protein
MQLLQRRHVSVDEVQRDLDDTNADFAYQHALP